MYLTSTGLVCPVGLDTASACAAIRAGISAFEELPYLDNSGEPVVGAMVPDLDTTTYGEERLLQLLEPAIRQCIDGIDPTDLRRIALIVGLAEPDRPGGGAGLADRVIGEIESRLGARFFPGASRAIPGGHTAGVEALRQVRQLLASSQIDGCVVAGVDSYLNAASLSWLNQHTRLKTAQNSDGVIPGESAAAILVQPAVTTPSPIRARLVGIGLGHEAATVLSEEPLMGLGLTEAARQALDEAGIGLHHVDLRVSDVTGESYCFREQALMVGRLLRQRRDELPIWHAGDAVGDCGAASAVSQLIIAREAFLKTYAPGDYTLCCASAVPGNRGVTIVRREVATT